MQQGMLIAQIIAWLYPPSKTKKTTPFWKQQCQMVHQKHFIKEI
jgi:hypothetical protein